MHFFPTPYPDELLYSILGRYAMRSGNVKEIHTIEDLFTSRNSIVNVELPSRLDMLINNMPINSTYTAEYFIKNHTLFPCYAAFVSPHRAEEIIRMMRYGNGSISYVKLGLTSGGISLNRYFRFCPRCVADDIEEYGEPYWHRTHQVTGVFMCSKHNTSLYDSKELIRGVNRQRIVCINDENCIAEQAINFNEEISEKMVMMSEDVSELLNMNFECRNKEWFKSQFRVKLIEKGYANMNNYIYQKRLRDDFIEFYSENYLNLIQSSVTNKSHNWLSNLLRKNDNDTYFLRYLILARFLDIPLNNLFNENLCLYENNKNKDVYQELWDKRLEELISIDLSIREIAPILHSSTNTIRKRIDELGIEPFWKYNGGGKYIKVKYTDTDEFKIKKEDSRKKWLNLLQGNPDKSSNQIKQSNQGLYRWVTKYDIEWLRENARRSKSKQNNVDWNKRDVELLENVKQVVGKMKEGKPQRITWTTIGSQLGISSWLYKKKDKLPLTKEYIESKIETLNEFHIRKIKWAISELEMEGKSVTKWNLIETAGVKLRYINSISEEMEEILYYRGYFCDFSTK